MGTGAVPELLNRVVMAEPPSPPADAAGSPSVRGVGGRQATLTSDLESSNSAPAFKPNHFPS